MTPLVLNHPVGTSSRVIRVKMRAVTMAPEIRVVAASDDDPEFQAEMNAFVGVGGVAFAQFEDMLDNLD